VLAEELSRSGQWSCISQVAPALVQAQPLLADGAVDEADPVYALQIIPDVADVRGASIKSLALSAASALQGPSQSLLSQAPRGSLIVHCLVPDLLRGVPAKKAKLLRRCETVADKLVDSLKARYECARTTKGSSETGSNAVVLQLLLLDPEQLLVSVSLSQNRWKLGRWPSVLPGGLAMADVDDWPMPSSAYRKLQEAFACLESAPAQASQCVDLGACPGGWTAAIRRLGGKVTAVDRSPLAPELMQDDGVIFVKGDAFTFEPDGAVDWLVSDVIAYPERILELLEKWCGKRLAERAVVTMKFQGDPDWEALDTALDLARRHGYAARAKHFFNNKNEVTMMLRADDV